MIFNVDIHIYSNDEDAMKEEIMARNSFTDIEIDEFIKFPRTRIMKITFKKTQIAKRATEQSVCLQ